MTPEERQRLFSTGGMVSIRGRVYIALDLVEHQLPGHAPHLQTQDVRPERLRAPAIKDKDPVRES